MILFAAIGALLALMGGFVYYASLDNPELEKVEIKLSSVELVDVNSIENRAELKATFFVTNPGERTFTVSDISYELFANGKNIGRGQYSTADIAMPGRAAFLPGEGIPLTNTFKLVLSDTNVEEYRAITSGEQVKFSVEGKIVLETAWSLVEKEFQSSM